MQFFCNSRGAWPSSLCALLLAIAVQALPLHSQSVPPTGLDAAKALGSAFADVFDKVAPAVVVIEGRRGNFGVQSPKDQARRRFDLFFRSPPGIDPDISPGLVEGSGFIFRPDGYILTNNHVLQDIHPGSITVKLKDGRKFDARIVGQDDKTDLAVLKIDGEGFPTAELGDSEKVRVGEFALAIGSPFNLPYSFTAGVVSAKGRSALTNGLTDYEDYIQTDASINPGNSGGPLCDLDGRVIGINTVIYGFNRGLGFAIPSNMAADIANQLITKGRVSHSWLGINIETFGESVKRSLIDMQSFDGLEQGVIVRNVLPGTPASRSDLRPADVITEVDGVNVATAGELQKQILSKKIGQDVSLNVWRSGRFIRVSVKTGERPTDQYSPPPPLDEESAAPKHPFGFQLQELTSELARKLALRPVPGVVVTEVEPNSSAATAEIRVGDIITRVGDTSVTSPEDVYRALDKADLENGVVVLLQRGDQRTFAIIK